MTSTAAEAIADLVRPITTPARIFPLYVASRIRRELSKPDGTADEQIINTGSVGLRTIGDCQYAVTLCDFNGTSYRATVMTEADARRRDDEHELLIQCLNALRVIEKNSRHLIEGDPHGNLTARLIASVAKETREIVEHVHG